MLERSIHWRDRIRATGYYLGLLPFFWLFPGQRTDAYSKHHFGQACALFALFFGLTLTLAIVALVLSYLLIHNREIYAGLHLERYLLGFLRKLYLAWAVFWLFGIGLALIGSMRPMPLLHRLAHRPNVTRITCCALLALGTLIVALVPMVIHGETLAPLERDHGKVHFLYEDNGMFPRWLFVAAFYPMTRTATTLWGDETVVIQRIERDRVLRAAEEAEVIYLGTHGTSKGLMLGHGWLVPGDVAGITNPNLKFVYISGCDSGQQRDGWLAAFAPAEVVTYDRLSAVLEHAWWLWVHGASKLKKIHGAQSP